MRVLIADDEPALGLLYSAVLRDCGHEPTVCENGRLALDSFAAEAFPLLILDWQMPEVDGVEVCRQIRQMDAGRRTFILMITARNSSDALTAVLDAGADDYLAKPATPEHLTARIRIAEQRIALDEARRAAEAALGRAQWLAGIGETTLALQHEINNPLAALMGAASLFKDEGMTHDERRELANTVLTAARRVAGVVKRLSNLAEPKSVEYVRGMQMLDLSPPREESPPRAGPPPRDKS